MPNSSINVDGKMEIRIVVGDLGAQEVSGNLLFIHDALVKNIVNCI